ncbi:MAG: ferredoxin--NADP reductase [Nitrospirota bacterium]
MNYSVHLLGSEEIAKDTMAFRFEKPAEYRFSAGQFCFLNLPDAGFSDERGLRRHLSIASSPLENELLFATKMSASAFKQTLRVMRNSTAITIEQPLGHLALSKSTALPSIFLAGGIGITPFRSMIRYAAEAGTGHTITLFYSNRTPEEAAFLGELEGIAEAHGSIRVLPTMTRMQESSVKWTGLTGRIDAAMIETHCRDWRDSVFYTAGPPAMVDSMRETLDEMHIGKDRMHIEKFSGY